jgi:TPR repeat protein
MKLIPALLLGGMLVVSGCSKEDKKPATYSSKLRKRVRTMVEGSPCSYSMESYSTEMLKRAEAGNADEQHNLGKCYEYGNGVTSDYKEAVMWYRKSAEQGNVNAQCDLGFCYDKGKGVTQDYKEALKWYTKSATQGNANAQRRLGDCYFEGKGVAMDGDEAVKWYTKAKSAEEQADTKAKEALEKMKSK